MNEMSMMMLMVMIIFNCDDADKCGANVGHAADLDEDRNGDM